MYNTLATTGNLLYVCCHEYIQYNVCVSICLSTKSSKLPWDWCVCLCVQRVGLWCTGRHWAAPSLPGLSQTSVASGLWFSLSWQSSLWPRDEHPHTRDSAASGKVSVHTATVKLHLGFFYNCYILGFYKVWDIWCTGCKVRTFTFYKPNHLYSG